MLSLSWLVGVSWLLARVLVWSYSFYDTCCRLRCFLQPPKQSWFWSHLGLVSVGVRTGLGHWGGGNFPGVRNGDLGGAGVWDIRE